MLSKKPYITTKMRKKIVKLAVISLVEWAFKNCILYKFCIIN